MAKVSIDFINSAGIRAEMAKDSYTTAEFFGTYAHPDHSDSKDWEVRLYRAADALVFDTNGDPVWEGDREGFASLVAEYGIDLAAATADEDAPLLPGDKPKSSGPRA